MPRTLKIETRREICARERAAWRSLGCLLDVTVRFERSTLDGLRLSLGTRLFEAPRYTGLSDVSAQTLMTGEQSYQALAADSVTVTVAKDGTHVASADIASAAMQFAVLFAEDDIQERAEDGTISAFSVPLFRNAPTALLNDVFRDLARLLSVALDCPLAQVHPDNAPFSVVFSCDVDGAYNGPEQVDNLMSLLQEIGAVRPTFMIMTETEAEKTFFDPIYGGADDWVQSLLSHDVECGLHSSFGAMLDLEMLAEQKQRLEELCGYKVVSHRAHYLRYRHPVTTGYLSEIGIRYDCSVGYYDSTAIRNGSSLPVCFADPAGRNKGVWSLPLTILDQHLFMPVPDGLPSWDLPDGSENTAGRAQLFDLIDKTAERGGVMTLDWHLHSIAHDHTPHHRDALKAILEYARAKGAWIGGVAAFHDRFDALYATHIEPTDTIGIEAGHSINVLDEEEQHYRGKMRETTVNVAEYVDATAATLRAILPKSAERIVDIGCGHGWISQRIPPFHKVLCMDLTQDIMADVVRPKAIGSILDMPLNAQSVEFAMASDVVEHLTIEERAQAMQEITRVARDYVYLQVPHDEALPLSSIGCPACKRNWHVNFHKDSFKAQKLIDGLAADWVPTAITYTGNLAQIDNTATEILDSRARHETALGFAGNHTCPYCSENFTLSHEQTAFVDDTPYQQDLAERVRQPLQASEVGVLFVRKDAPQCHWVEEGEVRLIGRNGTQRRIPDPLYASDNLIDFSQHLTNNSVTSRALFPYICATNCVLRAGRAGMYPIVYDGTEVSMLNIGFPRPGGASKLTIELDARAGSFMFVQGFTSDGKELFSNRIELSPGSGTLDVDLPSTPPAFSFQFIITGHVELKRAYLNNPPRQTYVYDVGQNWYLGHLVWKKDGITYFLIVPANGKILSPKPITEMAADDFSIQP